MGVLFGGKDRARVKHCFMPVRHLKSPVTVTLSTSKWNTPPQEALYEETRDENLQSATLGKPQQLKMSWTPALPPRLCDVSALLQALQTLHHPLKPS